MPTYLVPQIGDNASLEEVLSRAKIPYVAPKDVRSFILETEGKPFVVAAVPAEVVALLGRFATQFFSTEMPLVVDEVPGLNYMGQNWGSSAATFPPINFDTFRKSVARSGVIATDPAASERQSSATNPFGDHDIFAAAEKEVQSSLKRPEARTSPHPDDVDFDAPQ